MGRYVCVDAERLQSTRADPPAAAAGRASHCLDVMRADEQKIIIFGHLKGSACLILSTLWGFRSH